MLVSIRLCELNSYEDVVDSRVEFLSTDEEYKSLILDHARVLKIMSAKIVLTKTTSHDQFVHPMEMFTSIVAR